MQERLLLDLASSIWHSSINPVVSKTCRYVPSIRVSKFVSGVGVLSLKRVRSRLSIERSCDVRCASCSLN